MNEALVDMSTTAVQHDQHCNRIVDNSSRSNTVFINNGYLLCTQVGCYGKKKMVSFI